MCSLFFFSFLGTLTERMTDKLNAKMGEAEEYLGKRLNCSITPGLKISYKGLNLLRKVASSYIDLITDTILLRNVSSVVWGGGVILTYHQFKDQFFLYKVMLL